MIKIKLNKYKNKKTTNASSMRSLYTLTKFFSKLFDFKIKKKIENTKKRKNMVFFGEINQKVQFSFRLLGINNYSVNDYTSTNIKKNKNIMATLNNFDAFKKIQIFFINKISINSKKTDSKIYFTKKKIILRKHKKNFLRSKIGRKFTRIFFKKILHCGIFWTSFFIVFNFFIKKKYLSNFKRKCSTIPIKYKIIVQTLKKTTLLKKFKNFCSKFTKKKKATITINKQRCNLYLKKTASILSVSAHVFLYFIKKIKTIVKLFWSSKSFEKLIKKKIIRNLFLCSKNKFNHMISV